MNNCKNDRPAWWPGPTRYETSPSRTPKHLGSKLIALCFRCHPEGKLKPTARRGDFWCPDCTHALFWERRETHG